MGQFIVFVCGDRVSSHEEKLRSQRERAERHQKKLCPQNVLFLFRIRLGRDTL